MLKEELVESSGGEMLLMLAALPRRPLVSEHVRRVTWTSVFDGRRRGCNDNQNENDVQLSSFYTRQRILAASETAMREES